VVPVEKLLFHVMKAVIDFRLRKEHWGRFSGFHGSEYEDGCLLGCYIFVQVEVY
jgi:hypothetical protein